MENAAVLDDITEDDFDIDARITVGFDTKEHLLGATSWVSCAASCSCTGCSAPVYYTCSSVPCCS